MGLSSLRQILASLGQAATLYHSVHCRPGSPAEPQIRNVAYLLWLVKREFEGAQVRAKVGEKAATPHDLRKASERVKKLEICHPERSEGSLQLHASR
jgi:hypothetical protein